VFFVTKGGSRSAQTCLPAGRDPQRARRD